MAAGGGWVGGHKAGHCATAGLHRRRRTRGLPVTRRLAAALPPAPLTQHPAAAPALPRYSAPAATAVAAV